MYFAIVETFRARREKTGTCKRVNTEITLLINFLLLAENRVLVKIKRYLVEIFALTSTLYHVRRVSLKRLM